MWSAKVLARSPTGPQLVGTNTEHRHTLRHELICTILFPDLLLGVWGTILLIRWNTAMNGVVSNWKDEVLVYTY